MLRNLKTGVWRIVICDRLSPRSYVQVKVPATELGLDARQSGRQVLNISKKYLLNNIINK